MAQSAENQPWEDIERLLLDGDGKALDAFIDTLTPAEAARSISLLPEESQAQLLTLLHPEDAADLLEELPDAQGADIIEDVPVAHVAAIVDEMESDERADLLGEMDRSDAEAVLAKMDPTEAAEARELLEYDPHTAGGIMITEFVVFDDAMTVQDVLDDLRKNAETYSDYRVQYAYVVSANETLIGVLVLHDLLLSPGSAPITHAMIPNPIAVPDDMDVDELVSMFDRYTFSGLPVIDASGKPVGVVRRGDAEEVHYERSERTYMQLSGIIGGQELRSMPLANRSANRLVWLGINLVLSVVAAVVIVLFQDTVDKEIALAALIPVLVNVSGCSGNQAIAVSIRELALGLALPKDAMRVVGKELGVGAINGVVLALLLSAIVYVWKQDPILSFVVGLALALNTILAVVLGGAIPLLLRRIGIDPALAAAPMLTTVVDMCGFFLILSLAATLLG